MYCCLRGLLEGNDESKVSQLQAALVFSPGPQRGAAYQREFRAGQSQVLARLWLGSPKTVIHPSLSGGIPVYMCAFLLEQAGCRKMEPKHDCAVRLREHNADLRELNRVLLERCAHLQAGREEDITEIHRLSHTLPNKNMQ